MIRILISSVTFCLLSMATFGQQLKCEHKSRTVKENWLDNPSLINPNANQEVWDNSTLVAKKAKPVAEYSFNIQELDSKNVTINVSGKTQLAEKAFLLFEDSETVNDVLLTVNGSSEKADRTSKMQRFVSENGKLSYSIRTDLFTLKKGRNVKIATTNLTFGMVVIQLSKDVTWNVSEDLNPSSPSLINDPNLKIFPNPVSESDLTILFAANENKELVSISIYQFSGRLIAQEDASSTNSHRINTSTFKPGTYLVKTNYSDGSYSLNQIIKL